MKCLSEQDIVIEKGMQDKLYIGNSDSILLFGCEAQQQLRELSKTIVNQLLYNNADLEYVIQDIVNEIDDFQNFNVDKTGIFRKNQKKKRADLIKKYNSILEYMNKLELSLKLQEAQLLKESKIYEETGKCIQTTTEKLGQLISYGENALNKQLHAEDSEDIKRWYERLARRLEDLRISYTVLLQCKLQIDLMLDNSDKLIDKIVETITGTLPVWRNQVTILLGVEHITANQVIQNKLTEINKTCENMESTKTTSEYKEIDGNELRLINGSVKNALSELIDSEQQDGKIRINLRKSIR